MTKPKILIMHGSIAEHDAIGNDILWMKRFLDSSFECMLFCEHLLSKKVSSLSVEQVKIELKDPHLRVIYHHSIYWQLGEELLRRAKAKIIFKYHNVTPAKYFEGYCDRSVRLCQLGRLQTERFQRQFPDALWLGDSAFNISDLSLTGRKMVLAPFNEVESWQELRPNPVVLNFLKSQKCFQLLFVGRIAPNKDILRLIEILEYLSLNFGPVFDLTIIGKSYTPRYAHALGLKIERLGLGSRVRLVGEASGEEILAYYKGSDIFVCSSRHEGFCLPLIEAQFLEIPVVALDIPAVRETLGPQQFLLPDSVPATAHSIFRLLQDRSLRRQLCLQGLKNYSERFRNESLKKQFVDVVQSEVSR